MKYTYNEIPDKSKEGIRQEVIRGLATIAFWFATTKGVDKETFLHWLEEKCPTQAHELLFYMDFRNEHSELFKEAMV